MKTTRFAVLSTGILTLAMMLLISCAPSIPHPVAEQRDCITCHGNNGIKPYPSWHASRDYTNADCASCHHVKDIGRNLAGTTAK